MPRFTLIKHPTNNLDSEVTVTFDAELLDTARSHYDDFLSAAGFEIPLESNSDKEDFLAKEEDWMWNDALASKFRYDGPVGSLGADILHFPVSDS